MSYDAVKDFAPIIAIGSTPYYLAVNPSLGVNSVQDLIQLAKSKPGELKFASAGNGSSLHLTAELLKYKANIDVVHIPYSGGAASLIDLVAGRVQFGFYPSDIIFPQAQTGGVRILGVSSLKRTLLAPDVKTLDEQGVKGFDAAGWYGILAPARTPDSILTKLNDALEKMLVKSDARNQFLATGVEPLGGSREDLANMIKSELAKWGEIVRVANVKIQ